MKWRTFIQVMILILFTIFMAGKTFPINNLLKSGLCPFRYQYHGRETINLEETWADVNTGKELKKSVPTNVFVVFDTWTGKMYVETVKDQTITIIDFLNHKSRFYNLIDETDKETIAQMFNKSKR